MPGCTARSSPGRRHAARRSSCGIMHQPAAAPGAELVILITARLQKSPVEWEIHEPFARQAGCVGRNHFRTCHRCRPEFFRRQRRQPFTNSAPSFIAITRRTEPSVAEVTAAFGEKKPSSSLLRPLRLLRHGRHDVECSRHRRPVWTAPRASPGRDRPLGDSPPARSSRFGGEGPNPCPVSPWKYS